MRTYSRREWLNREDSESTGSVVAFHGKVERRKDNEEVSTFLEVADCSGKVSLHKSHADDMEDFIRKMRLLALVANDFATFLENCNGNTIDH